MKKSFILILAATILIFIGGFFLVNKGSKSTPKIYPLPANLTFYWGNGCPHCKNVEDFISSWSKKDSIKIDRKEVWYNAANATEMQARYASCGITDPNGMGVPLLFTPTGKCYSGDTPVIDYLKTL